MQTEKTLICIPDISGFTRFMSEFDFDLASKVVPSLLNQIIYANEIGLKISEIEGDAVLFYKNGELPSFEDLIQQCKYFYKEFYKQLEQLKVEYSNKEVAEKIPEVLGLKIILHLGEDIGLVKIGNHIKMLGEDVIKAHKFLKNNVDSDEYILLSSEMTEEYGDEKINATVSKESLLNGTIEDSNFGEMGYTSLEMKHLF